MYARATIQVLEQQTVWHAGLNGAFTIMTFPAHPGVVFVESLTGDLDIEGEADVRRFTLAFDYLRAAAAGVEESQELIARTRDTIEWKAFIKGRRAGSSTSARPLGVLADAQHGLISR